MTAPEPLTIRLFGPFAVWVHGVPLRHLRTRKGQWLLALLALRHPRPVDRTWLAETLWPDSGEALHNLRQCLADLRAALGSEAGRIVSPSPRTLGLNLDCGAGVDVLDFDAAFQRGDLPSLERAVFLSGSALLEDCREEWVAEERLPREQACLAALETLAGAAAEQKEYAAAVGYLRRAVGRDPYREEAHRALMRALTAGGAASAAVQVYRDLRRRLRHEMNMEPDAETTALFQRLRRESDAASAPPAPAPLAAPAQALLSPPCAVSSLIGREEAVREVRVHLAASRLVTLTGTGGVGKTRLALRVGESVLDDYPDGVWFADLAPLGASERVLPVVHAAVGLAAQPDVGGPEALLRFLRPRQGLLLLDNCEHLIAPCAALVSALLTGCANLRVLATSREPLSVGGETVWRVPSLTEEDAIRLFTARAAAAGAGGAPLEADAEAVAQICRRLDGIPLALELAAARLGLLSPVQVAARLDERFRLLTAGSRTALPRQQTLRATIDWSYDLLSPLEQTLFRRLSVFAGAGRSTRRRRSARTAPCRRTVWPTCWPP